MRKYRPSGRIPFLGFILLIVIGLIGGAAVGGILWALDNYLNISLVFVFPLLAGAIVGGLLVLGVRAGKVRSPFYAALIGLLAGVLIYGVYHSALYFITFRSAAREAYIENTGETPTDAELNRAIDKLLRDDTGETGIIGYLSENALNGFTITRSGYSSTGNEIRVEGNWVYVYYLAEILIAAAAAAWLAAREARNPFDEDANVWYGAPTRIGALSTKMNKALDEALKRGDFQTAGSLMSAQDVGYPRTDILVRRSPVSSVPPQDIYLMVNHSQRANRTTTRKTGVLAPDEFALLTDGSALSPSQRFDMDRTSEHYPVQQPSEKFRMD